MKMGRQKVTIVQNSIRSTNSGKEYVSLICETSEGESAIVKIWLTPKATQMAQRSLVVAGFDIKNQDLELLVDDASLLKGNVVLVDIQTEEWNGQPQLRVDLVLDSITRGRVRKIQTRLRGGTEESTDEVFPTGVAESGFTTDDSADAGRDVTDGGVTTDHDEQTAKQRAGDEDDIPF